MKFNNGWVIDKIRQKPYMVPKLNKNFEPVKTLATKGKTPAFADVHPSWLRTPQRNSNFFQRKS